MGIDVIGPLVVYMVGFMVSLIPSTRMPFEIGDDGMALAVSGIAVAVAGVVWFLWNAAMGGWTGFGLSFLAVMVVLPAGALAWVSAHNRLEDLALNRFFSRCHETLDAMTHQPEDEIHDPRLRKAGFLSFERRGGRTHFSRVHWNPGVMPPDLEGFIHVPTGAPQMGESIPSPRHGDVGSGPFQITHVRPLKDAWWWYLAQ